MTTEAYPHETIRLLHERASVRQFADRPIEPEVEALVLGAGAHAANGAMQSYSIIRITDQASKQRIFELDGSMQKQILRAPLDLLFCVDMHRNARWAGLEVAPFTSMSSFEEWWISFQDVVICAQSICTAADAMGLGSVYIGTVYWYFRELREHLQLPRGVFPVVLVCMGYPKDERPKPRRKLGLDILVHDNRYREIPDDDLLAALDTKYGDRIPVTEDRVTVIAEVCRKVGGEELADRCVSRIRENGFISMVQYLYGLAYRADKGTEGNAAYLDQLEEAGFDWFRAPGKGDGKA